RAIAGQGSGHVVERGKRTADAGVIFQGVETGIERDGQSARIPEVVAELHAFVTQIAERGILGDAVHAQAHAQAHAAAFAADKPAVGKIVARIGKAPASDVAAAKARKVAVS